MNSKMKPLSSQFLDYRHTLMAFIRALVRDNDVAEDIFQEVWVKLAEGTESGLEVLDVKKWCRGTAKNLILQYWQKNRGQKIVVDTTLIQFVAQSFEEQESERLLWDARREALRHCIEELPAKQKQVLQLRYDEQLPIATIAARLQKTAANIMVVLSRTRFALADCADYRMKCKA
jgi:RNA polymerase sigma-70 factor (ECF subfamily)